MQRENKWKKRGGKDGMNGEKKNAEGEERRNDRK
jgi:hypothetical protein